MKLQLLTFILVILWSASSNATSSDELFEKANSHYSEEDYDAAASLYDSIQQSGVVSAEVYYNLANSYYKQGKTAPAILYYERALRLRPGDEDIRHNLELANLRVITKLEKTPPLFYKKWWNDLLSNFPSGTWSRYGTVAIWLAFFMGVLFLYTRSTVIKRISFFGSMLLIFCCLVLLLFAYSRHQMENDQSQVIVTVPNVYVKSAPDDGSTDLFILHEGVKGKVTDEVNEWKKIRLSDGKVGWIQRQSVEVI